MWEIISNHSEAVAALLFTTFFAFLSVLMEGSLDRPQPGSRAYYLRLFKKTFGYLLAATPCAFLLYVLSTGELVAQLEEISGLFFMTLIGLVFLVGTASFFADGERDLSLILIMIGGLLLIFPLAAYLYQHFFESSLYTNFKELTLHLFNLILYPALNLTIAIVFIVLGFHAWQVSRKNKVFYYYPSAVLCWLIAIFLFLLPGGVAFINYYFGPSATGQQGKTILLIQKHFNNVLEIFQRYWEGLVLIGALGSVLLYFKRDRLLRRPFDSISLFLLWGYLIFFAALGQFIYSVVKDFKILLALLE